MTIRMFRDVVFRRKGPVATIKRLRCWWYGGHDWSGTHTKPMPLRPKICKVCGAEWKYIYIDCPPPHGWSVRECPRCLMLAWYNPEKSTCTCDKCAWVFEVFSGEQYTCAHCGRKVAVGTECPGCGSPR